eukprot:c18545_g1_i4.p1 GENE.c18545_g1_i4~~c18545_g1_i4.p1  ORF type:complete len:446 (+),score=81.98 c18545_g1_i4:487-1824(+)
MAPTFGKATNRMIRRAKKMPKNEERQAAAQEALLWIQTNEKVVFLMDQWNSVFAYQDPFVTCLQNFSDLRGDFRQGLLVFAVSSSFDPVPKEGFRDDGANRDMIPIPSRFSTQEAQTFIAAFRARDRLPPQATNQIILDHSERIPRLMSYFMIDTLRRHIHAPVVSSWTQKEIVQVWTRLTTEYYRGRILSVLKKTNTSNNSQAQSYAIVAALMRNTSIPPLSEIWKNSGLFDEVNGVPVSDVAKKTMLAACHEQVNLAVQILAKEKGALELAFCDRLRQSQCLELAQVNMFGKQFDPQCLKLCVRDVVDMAKEQDLVEINPDTAVICRQAFPVIDVFVYLDTGTKLLVQLSQSSYQNHSAKLPNLFTSKTDTNETVFEMFKRLTRETSRNTTTLPASWLYVFITTQPEESARVKKGDQESLGRTILVAAEGLKKWGAPFHVLFP